MKTRYLICIVAVSMFIVAASSATGITSVQRHPDAPAEVDQFGRLVGSWDCKGANRQQDGSWKESPGIERWDWFYILDGYAIQDVWRPDIEANPNASQGTNLRSFNSETGFWEVIWTTQKRAHIEHYRAAASGDDINIYAERPASPNFPRHLMRITFHNISDDHFDWRYESSGLTDGQDWTAVARLSCDRVDAEGPFSDFPDIDGGGMRPDDFPR